MVLEIHMCTKDFCLCSGNAHVCNEYWLLLMHVMCSPSNTFSWIINHSNYERAFVREHGEKAIWESIEYWWVLVSIWESIGEYLREYWWVFERVLSIGEYLREYWVLVTIWESIGERQWLRKQYWKEHTDRTLVREQGERTLVREKAKEHGWIGEHHTYD